MNAKTLSILHFAGDILSDPSRRCTGTLAMDHHSRPVNPTDTVACRWCLTGALSLAMSKVGVALDATKERYTIYHAMKEAVGLPLEVAAPVYWDQNESMHGTVAERLVNAK